MRHLLCLGFGFSARHLAQRLQGQDWRITGTVRDAVRVGTDQELDVELVAFDGLQKSQALTQAFQTATHVLISAPPGPHGDPVLQHHRDDLEQALEKCALQWIGYLSTIGVYGDQGGAWVDETTPAAPQSERSKRRLEAETAWLSLVPDGSDPKQPCVQIFRLPGIYGPGRGPASQVLSGQARRIIKPGQVFNRIHVEDIAATLEAAMSARGTHDIYNLADDEPAPPQDVVAFAAEVLDRPVPPAIAFEDANLSPMGRSFYSEVKRVKNERIKQDLGVELRYPTYREGIRAIAQARTAG
ncbi:MAG: SDR family oxidoreductase [Filomicrobium sp.]